MSTIGRQGDLYSQLKDFEAFRLEDLPASLRNDRFLPQKLAYLESTGRLRRVRRGAYVVVSPNDVTQPDLAIDSFVVASVLARPYAISHHSGLAIRGLAEAATRRVYIQTTKRVTPLAFAGIQYVPIRVKKLFGTETVFRRSVAVQVTDIEKTLLDCLRSPEYAGGLDEFLRSIEGVERYDVLSAILDWALEHRTPPPRIQFRALFEDQRAELDLLEQKRLIRATSADELYLTLIGLAFCPHPRAEQELALAAKLFAYLRSRYKLEQDRKFSMSVVAQALETSEESLQRAAQTLAGSIPGVVISTEKQSVWPTEVGAAEPILDFRSLDQALGRQLAAFQPPEKLTRQRRSLAAIRLDRLLDHLRAFGDKSLYAKAGFLVTLFRSQWLPTPEVLRELSRHVSAKKYYFPSDQPKGTGKLIPEWNLIVPGHIHTRYLAARSRAGGDAGAAV